MSSLLSSFKESPVIIFKEPTEKQIGKTGSNTAATNINKGESVTGTSQYLDNL